MGAEVLRRAAALMREREARPTMRAVADWLDAEACYHKGTAPARKLAALTVANAYLRETANA